MSDMMQQAFIDAICNNSDNPTLRLIFADWLEEQGRNEDAAEARKELHKIRLPLGETGQQLTIIHNRFMPIKIDGLKEKIIRPWSVVSILFFGEWFINGASQKSVPGSKPEGTLIVGLNYMSHYTSIGHI